jgi:hypothetical protein
MTYELRRDPKDRKAEQDRKEGDAILEEFMNQNQFMEFTDGEVTKTFDFSKFNLDFPNHDNP